MNRIDRLSAKLKDIETALADPDLYARADHPDLQQLLRSQLGLIEDIESKEQEWLGLSQQLETIEAS
jgi:ATP-binding cassette subfamily F protein 3